MSKNLSEQESQDKSERLLKEYNERQRERERSWNPFLLPEDTKAYGRKIAQEILQETLKDPSKNLSEQESQDKSERLLKEYNERQRERERSWNPFLLPEDTKAYGRKIAQEILQEPGASQNGDGLKLS